MTSQDTSEFLSILEEAAHDGSDNGRAILESALEVLPTEGQLTPQGTPFEINVLINSKGAIAVATTRKIPNLRFRLGELMLEVIGKGLSLPGAIQNPIALVLSALSFMRNVNKLATLELDHGDAELLITIFQLTRDRPTLSLDALIRATPELDEKQRSKALERLEQFACVTLGNATVNMNETIIVKRT